jgi:hypothetical protein
MLLLVEQLFLLSSIQKTKNELVLQDFRFQWFCVGNLAVLTHAYRHTSILAKPTGTSLGEPQSKTLKICRQHCYRTGDSRSTAPS